MDITILDTNLVYQSFMHGAQNIISQKNELNRLNVFPVADRDTGNNLASLMQSVLVRSYLSDNLEQVLASISDAAIYGAKGNSGIIFAQYIQGFSEVSTYLMTMDNFSLRLERGFNRAYQAIEDPKEGTMITLMRTFSNSVKKFIDKSKNFIELIKLSYKELKEELSDTPNKLHILKENKVVDAGAKGFLLFVEGFIYALEGKTLVLETQTKEKIVDKKSHTHTSHFRYCVEALLENKDSLSQEKIKEEFSSYGDSLVVAVTKNYLRLHIHTDNPSVVFSKLQDKGILVEQKIDDMKRQYEVSTTHKDTVIVTDSIADLSQEIIDKYQIHVLPATITLGDKVFFDKLSITNEDIYRMMQEKGSYPTSSQPNIKVIENLFNYLTDYNKKIIVLTVSSHMSGTYQAIKSVSDRLNMNNITIIDTKRNSGAQGLLVKRAAQLLENGKTYEQIIEDISDSVLKSEILVSVKTLKYMMRSGRLKKIKGFIVRLLGIKPIVSIDDNGFGVILDKAFSLRKADEKIFKKIKQDNDTKEIISYSIVHTKASLRVLKYSRRLEKLLNKKASYITEISSVVAMNSGIGSIAVSYILRK